MNQVRISDSGNRGRMLPRLGKYLAAQLRSTPLPLPWIAMTQFRSLRQLLLNSSH